MANSLIIFAASYLYLIVVVLALGAFWRLTGQEKLQVALIALVALPLAFVLAKLLGLVIISPRPSIADHIQPLIRVSTDNGFPSDHTLLAMAAAMLVFVFNRRMGALLLVLAAFVGAGRVLAGAHHPIDVIGSTVIAAIAVTVGSLVEPRLETLLRRATPRQS
jgi:undecaprenyl-diphosphatase